MRLLLFLLVFSGAQASGPVKWWQQRRRHHASELDTEQPLYGPKRRETVWFETNRDKFLGKANRVTVHSSGSVGEEPLHGPDTSSRKLHNNLHSNLQGGGEVKMQDTSSKLDSQRPLCAGKEPRGPFAIGAQIRQAFVDGVERRKSRRAAGGTRAFGPVWRRSAGEGHPGTLMCNISAFTTTTTTRPSFLPSFFPSFLPHALTLPRLASVLILIPNSRPTGLGQHRQSPRRGKDRHGDLVEGNGCLRHPKGKYDCGRSG